LSSSSLALDDGDMWQGGNMGEQPSSFKRLAYGIVLYIWKLNAGHDRDPKECIDKGDWFWHLSECIMFTS